MSSLSVASTAFLPPHRLFCAYFSSCLDFPLPRRYIYILYISCVRNIICSARVINTCTFHPNPSIARAGVRAGSDGIVYIPCDREVLSTIQIRVLDSDIHPKSTERNEDGSNVQLSHPSFPNSISVGSNVASISRYCYIYICVPPLRFFNPF